MRKMLWEKGQPKAKPATWALKAVGRHLAFLLRALGSYGRFWSRGRSGLCFEKGCMST